MGNQDPKQKEYWNLNCALSLPYIINDDGIDLGWWLDRNGQKLMKQFTKKTVYKDNRYNCA